jgi:hypothetical protein
LFPKINSADGWTLNYVLNSPTSRIVVASGDVTAAGEGFAVAIPSTETKLWAPGTYTWLAVLQNSGQRTTLDVGTVLIEIDILDATAPQDTRSPNEIALANIEAMLANRGGDGVQEYTINGRMLRRFSLTELMQLRTLYEGKVRQERFDRGERPRSRRVAVHF